MNSRNKHTFPSRQLIVLCAIAFGIVAWSRTVTGAEIPAPSKGEFVVRVQENPGTGYVVALKQMSDGIYFLRTDPPSRRLDGLGAPRVRAFHFFNNVPVGQAGEIVFARFRPSDLRGTYTEERYVVRTGPEQAPRMLGVYVVPYQGGLGVMSVSPGSTADVLGIQRRDLLIRVNGQRVASLSDLHEAVELAPEHRVFVTLRRQGMYLELRMNDWQLPPQRPTPPHPPYPPAPFEIEAPEEGISKPR